MTNIDFEYPSAEDLRAIENEAYLMRANAVRAGFAAVATFLGGLIKRFGKFGVRHA